MAIKQVSVIIPARNEQDTIGPVLETLNSAIARLPQYRFETIVVVDNRADPTADIVRSKSARVVVNVRRHGKGTALYTGFRAVAGDVLIIFDSDGSHNPADIGLFLEAIEKGAGLVIGSRVLGGSSDHDVVRLFGNAMFTVIFSILFGVTIMDTLNGYKAFVKDVVSGYKPRARGFDVEIEIVAQAIRKGYQIAGVKTHENKRAGGRMKSRAFRDGFAILWACLREGAYYRFWRLCHCR